METDPLNATLLERHDLTDRLSIVRVQPDTGRVPPFRPGQFFRLGLPRGAASDPKSAGLTHTGRVRMTRRAYSVASAPEVTAWAEFFVVLVEEGKLTPRLWEIVPGDRLWMDGEAKGEFTLELAPPDRDLVMVSTGTGIAPFVSMLRAYRGQRRWRRFVLIHGVRRAAELAYRAEIETMAREDRSVVYIPIVSREAPVAGELRGRVQAALEPGTYEHIVGAPLTPDQCDVFLCGNPQMIDDVEELLTARGFVADTHQRRGNLHFERYW